MGSVVKRLYIMRSVPGGGKSHFANLLVQMAASQGLTSSVCSADSFFIGRDGVYRWDPAFLGRAHTYCQESALQAMQVGVSLVIIDNTNVKTRDWKFYRDTAEVYGYEVSILTCLPPEKVDSAPFKSYVDTCTARNSHGVPRNTIERMAKEILKSNERGS